MASINSPTIDDVMVSFDEIAATFIAHRDMYGDIGNCIIHSLSIDQRDMFVKVLNTCDCCIRHQTNRPSQYAPWIDTRFTGTQNPSCNCSCRHRARWICKTYNRMELHEAPQSPREHRDKIQRV